MLLDFAGFLGRNVPRMEVCKLHLAIIAACLGGLRESTSQDLSLHTQWLNAGTGYDSLAVTVGAWRSPGAHLHGVQGVVSSNLTAPTSYLSLYLKTAVKAVFLCY